MLVGRCRSMVEDSFRKKVGLVRLGAVHNECIHWEGSMYSRDEKAGAGAEA